MYFFFVRRVSSFPKLSPVTSINKHIDYGLKQFYLKVHPDLFTSYGEKYVQTNTQSLKVYILAIITCTGTKFIYQLTKTFHEYLFFITCAYFMYLFDFNL